MSLRETWRETLPPRKAVDSITNVGGVEVRMESEDGLDTKVTLNGVFWIAGEDREWFKAQLQNLLDRSRI